MGVVEEKEGEGEGEVIVVLKDLVEVVAVVVAVIVELFFHFLGDIQEQLGEI